MFLPGSWCRVRAPHCLWLDPSAISGYPEHTIKFSDEFGIFFQKHSWKIPS